MPRYIKAAETMYLLKYDYIEFDPDEIAPEVQQQFLQLLKEPELCRSLTGIKSINSIIGGDEDIDITGANEIMKAFPAKDCELGFGYITPELNSSVNSSTGYALAVSMHPLFVTQTVPEYFVKKYNIDYELFYNFYVNYGPVFSIENDLGPEVLTMSKFDIQRAKPNEKAIRRIILDNLPRILDGETDIPIPMSEICIF